MIGLQAQRVLQRRMEIAANNLANVATNGFKADGLVLDEAAPTPAHSEDQPHDVRFVRDMGLARDMTQGPIAMTGNPMDVALEGQGFFLVQGEGGRTMYTRDGAFSLTGDGRLVTSEGRPVLDAGGSPVTFDPRGEAPSIGRDGAIRIGGEEVGRIGAVSFAQPGALRKVGDNLWDAEGQPSQAFEGVIVQGGLEGSNVRPVIELTRLIEISRAYQSAANMVSSADDLRKRTLERLARAA